MAEIFSDFYTIWKKYQPLFQDENKTELNNIFESKDDDGDEEANIGTVRPEGKPLSVIGEEALESKLEMNPEEQTISYHGSRSYAYDGKEWLAPSPKESVVNKSLISDFSLCSCLVSWKYKDRPKVFITTVCINVSISA